MAESFQSYSIGGCSNVFMLSGLYSLTKETMVNELKKKLASSRVCFACINCDQDKGVPGQAIREVGGYVIEKFSPSYRAYMVVYAIPGEQRRGSGKQMDKHEEVDQAQLAMAKPAPTKPPKKRINWKKRYLALKKKRAKRG